MSKEKTAIELASAFEIQDVQGRIEFGFWSDVGDWIGDHCGAVPGGVGCQQPI